MYTKQKAPEILQIPEMTKELFFGGWSQFGPLSLAKLDAALCDSCVIQYVLLYVMDWHVLLLKGTMLCIHNFFFSYNDKGIAPDWFVGTQPSVSQSKSPGQGVSFFSHPRLPPILANFINADCCNNKCVPASSAIFSISFASLEPVGPICATLRYICVLSCV